MLLCMQVVPLIWDSKMQSLILLSTTEDEYIVFSSSLREVISVLNLLNELKSRKFRFNHSTHIIKCRVFEENKSSIEIATNQKARPQTKHLSFCLHHFHSHVISESITIEHISNFEQIANMFNKPLARDKFRKLRDHLMC